MTIGIIFRYSFHLNNLMLIKDIFLFNKMILNESLGISDFRKEVKEKWMGSFNDVDLKKILSYFKKKSKMKKEISLSDYVDYPLGLFCKIYDWYNEKEKEMGKKNKFIIVEETGDFVIAVPFTHKAAYYLSHKYLRHPGDEKSFGSGPSWCISVKESDSDWEKYCGGYDYPIAYFIISKKNSKDRYAIVFNNKHQDQDEEDKNNIYSEETFEDGIPVSDINGEIRDFHQNQKRRDVIKDIEKKFNVTLTTPINKRTDKINISEIIYNNFSTTKDKCEEEMENIDEDFENMMTKIEIFFNQYKEARFFNDDYIKTINDFKKQLKPSKDYNSLMFEVMNKYFFSSVGSIDFSLSDIIATRTSNKKEQCDLFYSCLLFCLGLDEKKYNFVPFIIKRLSDDFLKQDKKLYKYIIDSIKKNKYSRTMEYLKNSQSLQNNLSHFVRSFKKEMLENEQENENKKFISSILKLLGAKMDIEIPLNGFMHGMFSTFVKFRYFTNIFKKYVSGIWKDSFYFFVENYKLTDKKLIKKRNRKKLETDVFVDINFRDILERNFFEIHYMNDKNKEISYNLESLFNDGIKNHWDGSFKKSETLILLQELHTKPEIMEICKKIKNSETQKNELIKMSETLNGMIKNHLLKNGYEMKTIYNKEGFPPSSKVRGIENIKNSEIEFFYKPVQK